MVSSLQALHSPHWVSQSEPASCTPYHPAHANREERKGHKAVSASGKTLHSEWCWSQNRSDTTISFVVVCWVLLPGVWVQLMQGCFVPKQNKLYIHDNGKQHPCHVKVDQITSQLYLGYKHKNNWLIIDIIILRNSNCVTCLKTLVSNKYFSVILRFLTKWKKNLLVLVILRSLKTQIMGLWLRLCRCGFIRQQTSCHHICF